MKKKGIYTKYHEERDIAQLEEKHGKGFLYFDNKGNKVTQESLAKLQKKGFERGLKLMAQMEKIR